MSALLSPRRAPLALTIALAFATLPALSPTAPPPGWRRKATPPLALPPVGPPPSWVEGFVREYLRELNFGQGVALSTSSVNDQYLALAKPVRHYLMARWLESRLS